MISLCEQCAKNDWIHMQEIIDIFKECGIERPNHVWCAENDRPEDLRWDNCIWFEPMCEREHEHFFNEELDRDSKLPGHRRIRRSA